LDFTTAGLSVLGFLLASGILLFAAKVAGLFGKSLAGNAWRYFTVASGVLVVISLIALLAALESLVLPAWWREGSALVFRAILAYAVYHFYKAWTKMGK
jgi:hypothetical protein